MTAAGPGPTSNSERVKWDEEIDVALRTSASVDTAAVEVSGSFGFFPSEMNQAFREETRARL